MTTSSDFSVENLLLDFKSVGAINQKIEHIPLYYK